MVVAFPREIVGWSIDNAQDSNLVVNALYIAIKNRQRAAGGIAHADHGVQFTSWAFTNKIRASGLMPSFGTIDDCYDNSIDKNPSGRACRSSWIGRIAGQGSNCLTRYSLFSRSSTTVNPATHNSDTRHQSRTSYASTKHPSLPDLHTARGNQAVGHVKVATKASAVPFLSP